MARLAAPITVAEGLLRKALVCRRAALDTPLGKRELGAQNAAEAVVGRNRRQRHQHLMIAIAVAAARTRPLLLLLLLLLLLCAR